MAKYMERLNGRKAQDRERRQGVSDRTPRGQRRDTATSHDGDIESGEELISLKPNDSRKHQKQQKKNKNCKETDLMAGRPQSPKKACGGKQEQKMAEPMKKTPAKHPEDDKRRDGNFRHNVDSEVSTLQQPRGKL